jgi:hypothetical protein
VAIDLTDGVAALLGHCCHVDRKVFVRFWMFWHVYSRPDETFSDLAF